MIIEVTLCTLALSLGAASEDEKQSEPQQTTQVVQSAPASNVPQAEVKPDQEKSQKPDQEEKEVNGVPLAAIEANLISYTNQERARFGLPPLQVDKTLMDSARQHAAWMTRNHSMVHTSRPVAENIAMGQPHSSDVVRAWMNSPGHRANILNLGYRLIGVAAFRAENGTIFWCQQFRH
jgi:uncharacterized protein YkwD